MPLLTQPASADSFASVNCAWIMKVATEMSLERMFEVSAKVQYVFARRDLSAFADGKTRL